MGRVLVTHVADRDPAHARAVALHLLSILVRLWELMKFGRYLTLMVELGARCR